MTKAASSEPSVPYVKGAFRHILHPPGQKKAQRDHPDEQWYINDHCFYVADDGTIHWFGITNPYPTESSNLYDPGTHRHLGHATAKRPFGPWTEHEHVMSLSGYSDKWGVGASFVIRHEAQYVMVHGYNTGMYVALSDDLFQWRQLTDKPIILLGEAGTRDPCIVRLDDGTFLLYGVAGNDKVSVVGLASSNNCIDWKVEPPALVAGIPVNWGGAMESPFVHRRGRWYYLFLNHSHHQYEETRVFASRDPRKFDWERPLCTIFAHAAEIFEFDGKTYISHCGIEDRHWSDIGAPYGLYLAELGWLERRA